MRFHTNIHLTSAAGLALFTGLLTCLHAADASGEPTIAPTHSDNTPDETADAVPAPTPLPKPQTTNWPEQRALSVNHQGIFTKPVTLVVREMTRLDAIRLVCDQSSLQLKVLVSDQALARWNSVATWSFQDTPFRQVMDAMCGDVSTGLVWELSDKGDMLILRSQAKPSSARTPAPDPHDNGP